MKKIFTLLMICALVLMTGCGGSQDNNPQPNDKKDQNAELGYKVGMIIHLNATENKIAEVYNNLVKKANINADKYTAKYYDNLKLLQMGLSSGDVESISVYSCVANYFMATNSDYKPVEKFNKLNVSDSFCFAMRKEDTALKADFDKAIDAMTADGTLDNLVKTYITDAKADKISKVDIPKIDGAQTIKVGVTGDLPPLDFVNADGTPTGFNTAILAEIAKHLNKNIELVHIDSGARAAALSSGQIDVIFWAIIPNAENFPKDIEKPEGVEFTKPYFKDKVIHLELAKK